MVIENEYDIAEEVYLKTDPNQHARIVTAIIVRAGGGMSYECACGIEAKWHYSCELAREKNVLASVK